MLLRLFLAACIVCCRFQLAHAGAAKPNIVIVITDDQGYADLSCHGNPVLKTPNLDKLHSQSIRLTDFHVAPMCTPTRGQLMSGQDCLRNGAMNVSSGRTMLRRGLPTLAELLAAGGYRTGLFGKWHLGDNYPYRPQDRGFRESLFFPSSHIGSAPDYWNNDYFDDTYNHNGHRKKYAGYCTDVFFGEAMRWMKTCADRKEPFFAYIAPNAPHGPLFVPQKYRDQYKGQKPNVASFFGMIANIDENMGKLDAFLRESKLRDDTLVIFLTDNGGTAGVPVFNAGMRGRKIELYDGGHRVPCFLSWPNGKLRPGGDVAELTTVQDIMPTLVDLCGLKGVKGDGVSLAPLLRGQTSSLPDRTLVIQFSRMDMPKPAKGDACVLWKRWRLVQNKELFNLADDPGQKLNVIDKHPDIAAKLRSHYEKWWADVSPRLDEREAIIVGSDAENPLLLSPADWEDSFFDQGRQVRIGLRRNGVWNIEVAKAGQYEIILRRWPHEANTPIPSGLPIMKHADGAFPEGVALPVAQARLQVGGFDARKEVGLETKEVSFALDLPAGRTRLQTHFLDAQGTEISGAYYVTVRRRP